jgi:hypothetical protein
VRETFASANDGHEAGTKTAKQVLLGWNSREIGFERMKVTRCNLIHHVKKYKSDAAFKTESEKYWMIASKVLYKLSLLERCYISSHLASF